MTFAFTFPGQGSQFVGMGQALAENSQAARDVFDRVDSALDEKLSDLMWSGPAEELTLTANTQPALMACSMAAMAALEEAHGITVDQAQFVAGHSLGEYTALCAAGAISLEDTARLLRIRGNAMQSAVPAGKGAMAALLGASFEQAEAVVASGMAEGDCQIANDNAPGQIVISGERRAVEAAAESAKGHGVKKAVILPVSAPFHCSLMQPAADAMADALENIDIHTPSVGVVNNVQAGPVTDPLQIRTDLVTQVTGRVRWRESMQYMFDQGVSLFGEPGCGKVLSVMMRRALPEAKGLPIDTPDALAEFAALVKG
ncbi:ACP S-malonyltransferase [Algimonas porphyrae]|uniref:Malonyl CoA-acyl carrier protein transacylase n=1 Tax=Algimonas porphyrae TaxID=1128113 RepID=A0ABQ5UX92_9PROT|nr:ACP S-malonyltransferase [Algimonas porphyrae]GLQ19909.1 malonyl CoA-acyl carrier protein transacylase [Algimonas porphyrae]